MTKDPMQSQREADEAYRIASDLSRNGWATAKYTPPPPPATEWERLVAQADALDQRARSLIGCTWVGDQHPSTGLREQAASLRRAAMLLKQASEKPAPSDSGAQVQSNLSDKESADD